MKAQDYFDFSDQDPDIQPELYELIQRWLETPEFQAAVKVATADHYGKLHYGYDPEFQSRSDSPLAAQADSMFGVLSQCGTDYLGHMENSGGSYVCGRYGLGWLTAGEGCFLASASCMLFHSKEFMW